MCLVLLVGLVPVMALASEEEAVDVNSGKPEGFYTAIDFDGKLDTSNYINFAQDDEGYWYLPVAYTAEQEKTLYYYSPNGREFTGEVCGCNEVETSFTNIYSLTLPAGNRGRVQGGYSVVDGGGASIIFTDGSEQLYFYDSIDGTYNDIVFASVGGTRSIALAIVNDGDPITGDSGYSVNASHGTIDWYDGVWVWDVTEAEAGDGWIWATKGNEYYLINVYVNEAQDDGNESTPPLPEGYEQMYNNGNNTEIFGDAGGCPGFIFSVDDEDGNRVELDADKYEFTVSNPALGKTISFENEGKTFIGWEVGVLPGTTGYICAVNKEDKKDIYAIKAFVGPFEFGVYKTSTPTLDNPGNDIVLRDNNWNFSMNYAVEGGKRTLYVIPGYDYITILNNEENPITIVNHNSSNPISATPIYDDPSSENKKIVAVAVGIDSTFTGEASATVTIYRQFEWGISEWEGDFVFTDDVNLGLEEGLYTEIGEDGKLIASSKVEQDSNFDFHLEYESGESAEVYFYLPQTMEFSGSEDDGLIYQKNYRPNVHKITLPAGNIGTVNGFFEFRDINNNGGGHGIIFNDGTVILPTGFYTALNEDGSLDPNSHIGMENLNGIPTFTIPYSINMQEDTVVYFYAKGLTNFHAIAASYVQTEDPDIYAFTLPKGSVGTIGYGVSWETTSGGGGGDLMFRNAPMFIKETNNEAWEAVQPVGRVSYLPLAVDKNGIVYLDGTFDYGCSWHLGSVSWDAQENALCWDASNAYAGTGYWNDNNPYAETGWIWAIKGDESYAIPANAAPLFVSASEELSGDENDLIYDGDIDNRPATPAKFTVGGTDYYMSPGFTGLTYPDKVGEISPSLELGGYQFIECGVNFFVSEGGNEYTKVISADALKEIKDAFGETLKFEVKAYGDDKNLLSLYYPEICKFSAHDDVYKAIALKLGTENAGKYIFIASGLINGKEVEASFAFNWNPRQEIYSRFEKSENLIAEVNNYIADMAIYDSRQLKLMIEIPDGTYDGYIIIPDTYKHAMIEIMGVAIGGNVEDFKTIINGGVICNGGQATNLNRIRFVGAGADNTKWTSGINAGIDNYALTGSAFAAAELCMINDYYVAVHGVTRHKAAVATEFNGNGTAILFGKGEVGNNPHLDNNIYKNNGIAIRMEWLPEDFPTSSYVYSYSRFINNDVDIQNDIKRNIYIPGCYFGDDNGPRECIYKPIGNQQGEGVGNLKKQVLYYPQATDSSCSEFIFDTDFYGGKNPIVSVNFTKTFPIPANALDGITLDVMKHDELLARIEFAESSSSSSRAASPYSLLRSARSGSEATFDATVEVERNEDGKTITIKLNDFPGGKTPTVSVPNTDGWIKASVADASGAYIKATVSSDYISFVAPKGGTYTITKVVDVPVIVTPPSDDSKDESETVINPDGSTTTTVTDKETGTVTETTEHKDGSSVVVTTEADGSVSTSVELSDKTVNEAVKNDEAVVLPIESVSEGETITVITGAKESIEVEIPAEKPAAGTVVIIVNEDGSETVITGSVPVENGVVAEIPDGAVIKVEDRSIDFADISEGEWHEDAVDFVSARGIMNGVGSESFAPVQTTTRAMIWTMLARLDGVDTSAGDNWYDAGRKWAMENGISDGTMATEEVTREQIVTMLWRYMGEPESDHDLSDYDDHHETSDWAIIAKKWAVEIGIIQGMGNGNLNPGGNASRAQVAQMLMNFLCQ